ncbi:Uncharacterised protein [Mycobacteroides abscessus subsp. abscessus]|nr:Uncharacterised protein [Mycobacteroides abscessus subsp. abscessus]
MNTRAFGAAWRIAAYALVSFGPTEATLALN